MKFPNFAMVTNYIARILGLLLVWGIAILAIAPRAEAGPYSALVVEVDSGRVLYEQNADELRHPASLTKMMTLYLVFEALSKGELSLNDTMVASAFAVSKPPSRLALKAGDTLTVEEGILGLVTQSANDAATVIAETLGGSEPAFAEMMTEKARQLGMNSTVFRNAQGLPDPAQVTTAWDMYRLAKALLKNFPEYYSYFSTESFWFRDHNFHNHNHLLEKYPGTDGIKTGFINSSGFNLVASAKRNGVRLVGVVFGGISHSLRDAHMMEILDDGFAQMEGHEPAFHLASFEGTQFPAMMRKPAAPEKALGRQPLEIEEPLRPVHTRPREPKPKKEMMALAEPPRGHEPLISHGSRGGDVTEAKAAQHRPVQANKTASSASRQTKAGAASQSPVAAPNQSKEVNPASAKKNGQKTSHAEIPKKPGPSQTIPAHKKI
jgi:D-alanyl-D-alanine carboxypeptidase